LERVSKVRQFARKYWFEIPIALLGLVGICELVVGHYSSAGPSMPLWVSIPTIVFLLLPLFARRRYPFAALAIYWILAAAVTFADGVLIPYVNALSPVGMATAFLLGHLRDDFQARTGLAIVVGGAAIVVYNIPGAEPSELVFVPMQFGISWLAGYALRERSVQAEAAEVRATMAEQERESAARVAVAEERSRIARELHDIVAHAVSVMVLQVGAVRHQLPGVLKDDKDALRDVERAGRRALTEMRSLLAAMRRDGEEAELVPQPGLDGLDLLVDEISRAGLPVEVHIDGEPVPLPRGIDLSAYRIVQEGLTNALKHARASDADVTVRYRPDELEIEVRDNGLGSSTTDGLGHGLVGVRERVRIYGGEMTAGTANGGGFVLSTRLPLDVDQP
jgi:signal transduction histidine kinase